jgi:hypothetical protein
MAKRTIISQSAPNSPYKMTVPTGCSTSQITPVSRMPDGLMEDDDAVGGGWRNLSAADSHLLARCGAEKSGFRRHEKFQNDPYWRDLIPFHEYFHGDNGAGIGASTKRTGRQTDPAISTVSRMQIISVRLH